MKIAVSAKGSTMERDIDERFGRCPYFIIVEVADGNYKFLETVKNIGSKRTGGAGSFAAKLVAEKKVDAVITGEVGPNAFEVLKQFGIKIHKSSGKVEAALKQYAEKAMKK